MKFFADDSPVVLDLAITVRNPEAVVVVAVARVAPWDLVAVVVHRTPTTALLLRRTVSTAVLCDRCVFPFS